MPAEAPAAGAPVKNGVLPSTVADIAAAVEGEIEGPESLEIAGFDGVDQAGPSDLTFLRDARFAARWASSRGGAALVARDLEVPGHDPASRALIRVDDADLALLRLLEVASQSDPRRRPPEEGVHHSAAVSETAEIDPTASIGPLCVIEDGARIGARAVVHGRVTVGMGVEVGEGVELHPGVTLMPGTRVGARSILHAGVVVGSEGFGYRPTPGGRGMIRIPHVAGVTIGRDVEIGANTAIDRGKFTDTTIGDGTKIDNLVQIGHSCRIGGAVTLCGSCGIAGSVEIGDGAVLGGMVGVPDNVRIAPGARISGGSLVSGNVGNEEPWIGAPARPASRFKRERAALNRVERLRDQVAALTQRLDKLERGDTTE